MARSADRRGGLYADQTPEVLLNEQGIRPVRRHYLRTPEKFAIASGFALCWLGFSVWASLPWLGEMDRVFTLVPSLIVVSLLAYLPGLLIAFLTASLLLDRQPPLRMIQTRTPLTVLIAARNEKGGIAETLRYLASQDYEGPISVILIDNGSTDHTAEIARATADEVGLNLRILYEPHPGKSYALNTGLNEVKTKLVITLDADTLLHPSAVRYLVCRLESSPTDVCAVAGCVLVRNSRKDFWTRLQEHDYFLGIASVKRMQGLFQSTLVAQGAFSLYRTGAVRQVDGWPDAIGEDIVLTWRLMQNGARVYFEPLAVAFTNAPEHLASFARQRIRWARGMIEAIRIIPPWRQRRRFARLLTTVDLFIPFLDSAYVFLWIPGIVLACFGIFWFVGPMTIAVLPLTFVVYGLLFHYQRKRVFEPLGLHVRRNVVAFFLFLLIYQCLMSTFSVVGYGQELIGTRRRWK